MQMQHPRKAQRAAFALIIALILAAFWGGSTLQAASVTLTIGSHTGAAGDEVKIPIQAKGAAVLGALQLELTYDPAVLQVVKVDKGSLMPTNVLIDSNTAAPGRLHVGFVTTDNITKDGELLVARFKVIGKKDQASALGLENAKAWEGTTELFDMNVTTVPGQFKVGTKSSFPWLWLIVAGIVVLLLLIIMSRKRGAKPAPATIVPAAANAPVVAPPLAPPATLAPTNPAASDSPSADASRFCSNCGTQLKPGAQFCRACGTRVTD